MAKSNNKTPSKKKQGVHTKTTSTKSVKKKINDEQSNGTGPYYVVCIGASAGGLTAVGELVSQLPFLLNAAVFICSSAAVLTAVSDLVSQLPFSLNAAVFIVLHISKAAIGDVFATKVRKDSKLPCTMAVDNEPIQRGHIYLATPDAHLLIKQD